MRALINKAAEAVAMPLKTRPLAIFSIIAFVFVILRLYISVEPLLLVAVFIGIMLLLLYAGGKIDAFIMWFIFLSLFAGIFSATNAINQNDALTRRFDAEFVRITGSVSSVPEQYSGTSFFVDTDTVYSHKGIFEKSFKVYVEGADVNNLKFGDRITFNAYLHDANEVNVKFSKHYLSKGAPLVAEDAFVLDVSRAQFPKSIVSTMRNYIISVGEKLFGGEAEMLFKALVAGDKSTFSAELSGNLSASGLSHIACVSGLHVSILGMAVYNLLRKRGKLLSIGMSLAVVYLFALVTGMSPSTLRAAIMFTSFLSAKLLLHENDSFTALCFSAMVLACINPYVIYDWGFILSFLSVLGIQIFSFYFKNKLSFLPEFMADSISVTIAAQITTLPAVVNLFGYLSVYSIAANIVVSVTFLVTLYLCFVTVIVSQIPFINRVVAVVCALFLDIIANVANLFADLPFSTISMNAFDVCELIVYYTAVILFVFREKLSARFMCGIAFVCIIALTANAFSGTERMTIQSVGEESYVFTKEDNTAVLSNDSLTTLNYALKDWGKKIQIDHLIVRGDVQYELSSLIDIDTFADITAVYISEEYKNPTFEEVARRRGITVTYFKENTDLYEYAKEAVKSMH